MKKRWGQCGSIWPCSVHLLSHLDWSDGFTEFFFNVNFCIALSGAEDLQEKDLEAAARGTRIAWVPHSLLIPAALHISMDIQCFNIPLYYAFPFCGRPGLLGLLAASCFDYWSFSLGPTDTREYLAGCTVALRSEKLRNTSAGVLCRVRGC